MQIALEMAGLSEIPADSAIYVEGSGLRRVLMGIDMGVAELVLAKQLGYEAVIAHHPQPAILSFPKILDLHIHQMVQAGVPEPVAIKAVQGLQEALEYRYHSGNYDHAPSVARLLGMPYLSIHNPLDELGRRIMDEAIQTRLTPEATVGDVVDALLTLPEFQAAPTRPLIAVGEPGNPAGKVVVAHGAGTNGGYEVANAYFEHGVKTVVYIHCDISHVRRLRQEGKGNLIISGHMVSDLVGINPFVRELERRGLRVDRVSGL